MKKSCYYILLILSIGCVSATCAQSNNKITITARNVAFPQEDPEVSDLSSYKDRRERKITIPVQQAALILIDVWDTENKRLNHPLITKVTEEKIAPLLKVARNNNMVVIHAPHRPIGWDGVSRMKKPADLRGPADTPRSELPEWVKKKTIKKSQWPPVEFIFRVGEYGKYSRYSNPSYVPYTQIKGIHKATLPTKRDKEYIESDRNKINLILKRHKILHLFYAGFGTNQCIVDRPAGIRNMSALGYNVIILRDATIGSEFKNTWETLEVTKAAILDIEINNGFSAKSDELVRELSKQKTI